MLLLSMLSWPGYTTSPQILSAIRLIQAAPGQGTWVSLRFGGYKPLACRMGSPKGKLFRHIICSHNLTECNHSPQQLREVHDQNPSLRGAAGAGLCWILAHRVVRPEVVWGSEVGVRSVQAPPLASLCSLHLLQK